MGSDLCLAVADFAFFSRLHFAPPRSPSWILPPCPALHASLFSSPILSIFSSLSILSRPMISIVFSAIYPTMRAWHGAVVAPNLAAPAAPNLLWTSLLLDDWKLRNAVHEAGDSFVRGQRSSTTFRPAYRYARPIRSRSALFTLHHQSSR